MKRPSVFDYHEYREYLKAWLSFLKESQGLSLRKLAKLWGQSPSYLSMLLKGERKFNKDLLKNVIETFSLDEREQKFLTYLITLGDDPKAGNKNMALRNMQKFKEYRAKNKDEHIEHKYLSNWYHVAIRELIAGNKNPTSKKQIVEKMKPLIGMVKLKAALAYLESNGFIESDQAGLQFWVKDKNLRCMDGVYKVSLSDFHQQMFGLAVESIFKNESQERLILGHTAALSEEQFQKISEVLKESLSKTEEVSELETSDSEKKVYHIGLAFFPVVE
jgi:uncharacterized protein (TIGR02147 family)